jgi:hypothetical protein
MTILGTSLFFSSLEGPVDALPLRIWRLASQPYESAHSFGWAAWCIILMVLGVNVVLRLLAHKKDSLLEQKFDSIFFYINYIDNPYVADMAYFSRSLTVEEVMREEKAA